MGCEAIHLRSNLPSAHDLTLVYGTVTQAFPGGSQEGSHSRFERLLQAKGATGHLTNGGRQGENKRAKKVKPCPVGPRVFLRMAGKHAGGQFGPSDMNPSRLSAMSSTNTTSEKKLRILSPEDTPTKQYFFPDQKKRFIGAVW